MTRDDRHPSSPSHAVATAHPDCARCQLSAMDHLEVLVVEVAGARLRSRSRFQLGIVRDSVESGQGAALYMRIPSSDRDPVEVTYMSEDAVVSITHSPAT